MQHLHAVFPAFLTPLQHAVPIWRLSCKGFPILSVLRCLHLINKSHCLEPGSWKNAQHCYHSSLHCSRYEEDVAWMALHLPGLIPFVVYNTQDSSTSHHTPVHNGNEAAAYLQFVVDYYDCLPDHMVFIHAHRLDAGANKVMCLQSNCDAPVACLQRMPVSAKLHVADQCPYL